MKTDLNVSGVDVLNSTHSLSFSDQSANILSLLMTRQGWHDPKEAIHQEALTAQDKQQRLTQAFENYTLHSADVYNGQALMDLLQEAEADLKAEYDYARKQHNFYLQEAEKETKSANGFLADWMQWIRQGVQDFFGSSNSGLADKYNQIAENRQSQLKELSKFKISLQQKLFLESTEKEIRKEQDEEIVEIDFTPVKANQRRLLQASSQVTVVQNIPDQTIDAAQQYSYPLDGSQIFNGNFTTLIVTTAGQNVLPGWLQFRTTDIVGAYTPTSVQYQAIKIMGNIACIADYNNGLKLIDITNPADPILIGSGPVGNPLSLDISAVNSLVYLANDNGVGLQVINISDPVHPTLVDDYPLPGSSGGVAVDGDFVYVVSASHTLPISVYVFNISQPSDLQSPIGSWSTTSPSPYGGGTPIGIQIQDQRAYLATTTVSLVYNVLYTLDVSNPMAPSTLATYQSPSPFDWYPYLTGFKVQGNFIYIGEQGNFIIMDISDPQNPSVLCKVGNIAGANIRALEIYGGLAYLGVDNEGVIVTNITDLANPTPVIAQYSTFGHVFDMQIIGTFAYLADAEGGLKIIDLRKNELTGTPSVSNVGKQFIVRVSACGLSGDCLSYEDFQLTIDSNLPKAIGNIPDQSVFTGQTLDVAISSDVLFSHVDQHNLTFQLMVTNSLGSSINPWIYLEVIPTLVGQVALGATAQYIKVQAGYAYVSLNNGFQSINVTNAENPQILSTYSTPDFCLDLQIQGELAYVAGASEGLLIFNVSDPSNLIKINTYNPSGGYLRGLFMGSQSSAGLAYLTWCGGSQNKLEIINVTNPGSIQSLGQLMSGSGILNMNPTAIQVQDGLAYIGNRYSGNTPQNQTLIVNVSNPRNPVAVSAYAITDFTSGMALQGNILYLAGMSQGLLILNVSNPFIPYLLGSIALSGTGAAQVFIQGTLAFIADMVRGLIIIDVSEPTRPQLIGETNFPTLLCSYLLGPLAYNGDFSDDYLQIMDISQRTIIGTPATTDIGNYQAVLTATDELGATATISFKIFVEGPPVINGTIPAQYAKIGQLYNYFVPQGVVTDPNNNPITFSAIQQGQSNLMPWLSFNSISATFCRNSIGRR